VGGVKNFCKKMIWESDEGEEIFLQLGLCFGLKNAAVLKSPNSEPESIYLATRIQMRVNRSRRFNLFILLFMFPKG
jgi:hypothetical protein